MASKTRIQPIDPTPAFATDAAGRLDALRTQVLPRLSVLKDTAQNAATNTYGFDVAQDSDEIIAVSADEVLTGLHPAEGEYTGLRNLRNPAFSLVVSATAESLGVVFRIQGAAEWRLFVKSLYQFREALGDYLADFDELYVMNSEGEEEVVEELDQLFAVDVDSEGFKDQGCSLYFPGLEYPVESEEDFETINGDFATLFPFYWTLLNAAHGNTVDMEQLLNA